VIDPKTRITLWNIPEYVRGAVRLGNREQNFDQAMSTVVDRVKTLMLGPSPIPSQSKTAKPWSEATLLNFLHAGRLRSARGAIPRTPLP
jgi:hypothetical protein